VTQRAANGGLAGKAAMASGAGSGIGAASAQAMAREGAQVAAVDVDFAAVGATADLAAREGLDLIATKADLTDPAQAAGAVARVAEALGWLDILVNAAAVADFCRIKAMAYEAHWRRTLVGELDAVFLMCKAAWPHLIAGGAGAIVNFASANAYPALKHSPALAHFAADGGALAW
jgi:NAD(P)-dependent dehydrogenase (short-subunit alcohol dehydrogenase family)